LLTKPNKAEKFGNLSIAPAAEVSERRRLNNNNVFSWLFLKN